MLVRGVTAPVTRALGDAARSSLPWESSGGPGAAPVTWTPLGVSTMSVWLAPAGISGNPIDSIANAGTAGGSFVATAGNRPFRTTKNGVAVMQLDGVTDLLSSTLTPQNIIGNATSWHILARVCLFSIPAGAANPYQDPCIIRDNGGFWGLHVRDNAGTYEFQLYVFAPDVPAATPSVRVVRAPYTLGTDVIVEGWHDGTHLHLRVGEAAEATPVTAQAPGTRNQPLIMGQYTGKYIGGTIAELMVSSAQLSASDVTAARAYLASTYGTFTTRIAATKARMWGNAYAASTAPIVFWSSSAMQVVDTDADAVDVEYYCTSSLTTGGYLDGAIVSGSNADPYGATEVYQIPAQTSSGVYRTGLVTVPGSGTRRVWAVDGCLSAGFGAFVGAIHVPSSATTAAVTETGDVVAVSGAGSRRSADDGFVVSAGVLSSTAPNIALRAAFRARIADWAPTKVWTMIGTNDGTAGVSASDWEVALGARIDEIVGAGVAAADITICSIVRRPSVEASWAPGYRTAASNVATAKGCAYVDGLPILDVADIGVDGLHPAGVVAEGKLAAAIASACGTTGRLMLDGDSIICGSTSPEIWATARGVVPLVRIGRI